jgi:hypothetical protein
MAKTQIHHVILLDQSSSMSSTAEEARSGFNEVIDQIKLDAENYEDTQEHLASLVVFNQHVDRIHWLEDVANLEPLTEAGYRPGGMTSLRDAIGSTIVDLQRDLKAEIASGDVKIFLTVITDGEDTSSREYDNDGIKSAIDGLEQDSDDSPWTLTLVGANIDAVTTGRGFGLKQGMSANYVQTGGGTKAAFASMRATRGTYSTAVSKGLSKGLTDDLVAHTASVGRSLTDDEIDQFVADRENDQNS